jgi:hypothetical protein
MLGDSKNAVTEKRVEPREGLGDVERCRASRNAEAGESLARRRGNWLLRQRMRKRLEARVVFEGEVRAFVGFDEEEDGGRRVSRRRSTSWRWFAFAPFRWIQREPMRIGEARRVALPVSESRDVVAFASHDRDHN